MALREEHHNEMITTKSNMTLGHHTPLVSVVIPVYNVECYLERCLDSVVGQTYDALEIILVDDGSEDQSGMICDYYAQADSRISVLHRCNRGLSAARNAGIAAANGEYLSFIDSDDYVAPHFIKTLVEAATASNSQLAVCGFVCEDEDGSEIHMQIPPCLNASTPRERQESLMNELSLVVAWNKLYARNVFENLRFKEGKQHEDEFIMHHILNDVDSVACTSEILYYYVRHDGSLTNTRGSLKKLDVIEALLDRFRFYSELSYDDFLPHVAIMARNAYLQVLRKDRDGSIREDPHVQQARGWIQAMERELPLPKRVRTELVRVMEEMRPDTARRLRRLLSSKAAVSLRCFFGKERQRKREVVSAYERCGREARFLLLDTPVHGNIGDQAIALAERRWLEDVFGPNCFYEISAEDIDGNERQIARRCPEDQVVLIHGGGFLGCLWPNEERRFRRILAAFRNRTIIVLPQTVTFDMSTAEGRKIFDHSRKVYADHPDLTICLREKNSVSFMQENMPELDVELIPDMVLSLQPFPSTKMRNGALLCMRRDRERAVGKDSFDRIKQAAGSTYSDRSIKITDTVIDRRINILDCEKMVVAKLDQFARASFVVTDRLHGMVFAALTGTPCIALNNSNGKVKAVHEWIKDLGFIHFVDSDGDIDDMSKLLEENVKDVIMPSEVAEGFDALANLLESRSTFDREESGQGQAHG